MDQITYHVTTQADGTFALEESRVNSDGYVTSPATVITQDLTDGGYGPEELAEEEFEDVLWELVTQEDWLTAEQLRVLLREGEVTVDAEQVYS
mgnify:CR=1 FL=1